MNADTIRSIESRIAKLEKRSGEKQKIEQNIDQIKSLYSAGVLSSDDYFKYLSKLESQMKELESPVATNPNQPKVGDILYSSWGYSMTIVDFYKVVKVSPSGKSVCKNLLKAFSFVFNLSTTCI